MAVKCTDCGVTGFDEHKRGCKGFRFSDDPMPWDLTMLRLWTHVCEPGERLTHGRTTMAATEARERSIEEQHAKREAPVPREELIRACQAVRSRFAGNGTELSDAIADAFAQLAEELK